ncbi:hypothetical protein EXE44_19650, partial [Halorubrum sp. SS7]
PDRTPESVEIDPASPETGEIVFAPLNPGNDKRYGVSNVTISVCAGDGNGEEEGGDDRTGDGEEEGGDSSGTGNG